MVVMIELDCTALASSSFCETLYAGVSSNRKTEAAFEFYIRTSDWVHKPEEVYKLE